MTRGVVGILRVNTVLLLGAGQLREQSGLNHQEQVVAQRPLGNQDTRTSTVQIRRVLLVE